MNSVTADCESSLHQLQNQGEAESEAVGLDSDLKALIEGWPALPEVIMAGILAMIQAARLSSSTVRMETEQ